MSIQYSHTHADAPDAPVIHSGTGFTLEAGASQYLVTAAHILHDAKRRIVVEVSLNAGSQRISATPILPEDSRVDIAALELEDDLTVRFPLEPTTAGISFSQQIYFLGYPFGLRSRDSRGRTIPFIKSGIISAMDTSDPARHILYLDAHNNPGFSGGPIVFWHQATRQFRIAGVVSGYRPDEQPVYRVLVNPDGSMSRIEVPGVSTRENPGILVGYSIKHIVDAINAAQAEAGR